MKKHNIIGLITAMAVSAGAFSAFPASAGAAGEFALTVGGTKVTSGNMNNILGDGVFSFDGDRTLTVSGNCDFAGAAAGAAGINNEIDGLVINTVSDSTLTRNGASRNCIVSTKSIIFTGSGTLTVVGDSYGIYLEEGDMTADHADIAVRSGENAHGIYINKGRLIANTSHIIAEGGAQAVYAGGGRELTKCDYTKIDGNNKYVNIIYDNDDLINNAASIEITPMASSVFAEVTPPSDGEEASFAAVVFGEGCHPAEDYRTNGVSWYDETDERDLSEGETFTGGHDYTVHVFVDTDEGFSFPKWVQSDGGWPVIDAKINGKNAKAAWAWSSDKANGGMAVPLHQVGVASLAYTFRALDPVFEEKTWTAEDFGVSEETMFTSTTLSDDACLALNATDKRPITVDGTKRIKLGGEKRELELIAGYSGEVIVKFKHASSSMSELRTLSIMQDGNLRGSAGVEQGEENTAYANVDAGHVIITSDAAVNILSVTYKPSETMDSGMCGDDLFWKIGSLNSDDDVLTIYGRGAMYDLNREGEEPWYIYQDSISRIYVSEGVTNLGARSFENLPNLDRVYLPVSLETVGYSCFRGSTGLRYVYYAGDYDSHKAIYYDRYNAPYVEAEVILGIPSGICGRGQTWRIEDAVLNISGNWDMDDYTSGGAPWYKYIEARNIGVYYEDEYEPVTGVVINYPVQGIGESAFDSGKSRYEGFDGYAPINNAYGGYEDIKTVTIPASVKRIGKNAFFTCSGIEDVYYGGTEAEWNKIEIAEGNDYLKNANIHFAAYSGECGESMTWSIEGDTLTITGSGEMYDWENMSRVPWQSHMKEVAKIVINKGVTAIGNYAFMTTVDDASVMEVIIPSTVKRIGENAFANNALLAPPELTEGLEFIGNGAFRRCYNFETVTISEGVKEISHQAFCECSGIATIYFPSTLETIGNYAFDECSALADVYYNGTEAEWNKVSIGDFNNKLTLDRDKAEFHFTDEPERKESGRLPSKHGGKILSWGVAIPQRTTERLARITAGGDVSAEEPLIAASFDDGGRLIGTARVTGEDSGNTLDTGGAERIKLLWWRIDGAEPISDSEEIELD